ncbi:MAG TPA: DUF2127 domain-containing protein [Gaiellaceae bacterium]|nr:DUF2127 domain-containing protein [Gaiellaceae bacterium]
MHRPPGTEEPRRFRPRFHWELLACGLSGHELLGTDVAQIRPEDAVVVQVHDGLRWYRCLRCDSWLPLPAPAAPTRETLPPREAIELPRRGRALRDRIVLRIIAIDRAVHFVVLALLAVVAFLFASHEVRLRSAFYRIVDAVQGAPAGPRHAHGFLGTLEHLFTLRSSTLYLIAAGAAGYAVLEGVEAVGLWYQKRWAEYLTFVATIVFLPYEIDELTKGVSALKVIALVINLAIAIYLLFAKRLFGLRGGAAAEERERERDSGWEALERTEPSAQRGQAAT